MIYFPHPLLADDEGLLAVGGDLSLERLQLAYSFGIFPWYNQTPIIWWFTAPRCIVYPDQIYISRNMKKLVERKRPWRLTLDEDFDGVIEQCSKIKRQHQLGTWLNSEMLSAYKKLFITGQAHSIEVWSGQGELIGGLYGVVHGRIFYGESMFSKITDTSKYAFIHLAKYLQTKGCTLIDCQQDTPHMRSMGASLISKIDFWEIIKNNLFAPHMTISKDDFCLWLDSI